MIDTTKQAYEYAKRNKKVNEGVIEAYKHAYSEGYYRALILPDDELLAIIQKRYRSKEKIERDLAMSDARRGFTKEEIEEAKMHDKIKRFRKGF